MMQIFMDEAGRGPLAGPLFVGLVYIKEELDFTKQYPLFQDSKKLSARQRELAYEQIQALAKKDQILISTQAVGAETIDRYGVTRAINLAISKGLCTMLAQVLQTLLPKELSYQLLLTLIEQYRESSASDLELVLDGKHDFGLGKELAIRTTPKVHGDAQYSEIAMASILAKLERDRWMENLDHQYPGYGFAKHKGYGTKAHYEQIEQLGISPEHRKLFLKKMIPDWQIISFDMKNPFPRD